MNWEPCPDFATEHDEFIEWNRGNVVKRNRVDVVSQKLWKKHNGKHRTIVNKETEGKGKGKEEWLKKELMLTE